MSPELRAVVARLVGPVRRWTEHTQDHGVTRVYRVDDVWVKAHGGPRKYRQEQAAYRLVVPALAEAGFRVPSLLAHDDDARVLIVSHVEGRSAETTADRRGLHRQAGALLAVLHALPCDAPDPLSVGEAIVRRAEAWIPRTRGHLPEAVLARVRDRIGDGGLFAGAERVWCHRDFSPRNWLDDRGRFGLIDFEHAFPDLWLVDLLKLADADWIRDPGTRAAFFEAHPPLDPVDVERLNALLWLHAMCTVGWSAEHGDAVYEAHGRALLDRLAAGWRIR